MQEIYSNVTKVMVDTRQNSNLLYLPLDKIMQSTSPSAPPLNAGGVSSAPASAAAAAPAPADPRTRDDARARTRETR
jgi:membrane protease subunit HflK